MKHGACVGAERPDDWFPDKGALESGRCWEVFETCGSCPVREDCYEYAVSYPGLPLKGIWAGTTYEERRPEVRKRQTESGRHHAESYVHVRRPATERPALAG